MVSHRVWLVGSELKSGKSDELKMCEGIKGMFCEMFVDRPYLSKLYRLFQDFFIFYFHQGMSHKCLITNTD